MEIGIIAEEYSDLDVLHELTAKIVDVRRFSFGRKFIAHGCGKLRKKCRVWAEILIKKGCRHLIVLHDLDNNSQDELRTFLNRSVADLNFSGYIILIPKHEIEAWLLVDANALKKVFGMSKMPSVPSSPELILEPKEKLEEIVRKYSGKQYFNSIHNRIIANRLEIRLLKRKCLSFADYPSFINRIFS